MKQLIIFTFFLFTCININAQENDQISIVYLHDGSMIKGMVVEDHSLDVATIKIIDGTKLTIPLKTIKSIIGLNENIEFLKKGRYVQTKGVYKIISSGTLTAWENDERESTVWGLTLLNLTAGYQFNQFLSVGGGVSLDFYSVEGGDAFIEVYDKEYIPVFADFRGYILNKRVSPYYAFQVGYAFSTDIFNSLPNSVTSKGGAILHPTIGLRFASYRQTKFLLEAGYKFQYDERTNDRNNWVDKMTFKRFTLKFGVLF